MHRLALALVAISVLCLPVLAQPETPRSQTEASSRESRAEWTLFDFGVPDDPAIAFSTEGPSNNFFGTGAGVAITTGLDNSFFGGDAGYSNTTASANSFVGQGSGRLTTTGSFNSFFGRSAGYSNTTGYENSFFGHAAGVSNDAGYANSFFGVHAGNGNTSGYHNSCFGFDAAYSNTIGYANSFFGVAAGISNTTGNSNSFFGRSAGGQNTVENNNTFVGAYANFEPGPNPSTNPVTNSTTLGFRSYVIGSNNLVLGSIAGMNGATSNVNVGIGTPAPVRQLHLAGPNAVFRMDRSTDTAAFIMVRTDTSGNPMKTFVVGTNASGVNQGEFIINDVGTAVGGVGSRRMTILNNGNVEFTGVVTAADFASPSSIALKTNVRTLDDAVATVNRLRGVRFDWKDTGKPSVGVIAEEVEKVVPEVVAHEDGQVTGVNYAKLVPLLIEAVKEQQATIDEQRQSIDEQQQSIREERSKNKEQQIAIQRLQQTIEHQGARLEALERLLDQRQP